MDESQVKEQVREHYAEIARQAAQSKSGGCSSADTGCCSPSNVIPMESLVALDKLPDEVVRSSLGCGVPLEVANLKAGETVLDLGSGGGLDCFFSARQVGPTGHVIGVDMTPEMISLARTNAGKLGISNVEFRHGYLEDLPVEDSTVDVIISNCVINLSPDKDKTFREAFRVLKPGGRVAISDEVTRVNLPQVVKDNMAAWASCIAGAISEKEYLEKMQAAGFVDVRKVSGGEVGIEPVYSAKIVARKP